MAALNENLSPKVVRELARDLKGLAESPPEGIRVIVSEDNLANIHAEIDGPVGTPYEGGLFRMKLVLGHEYPEAPPKGFFVTRIFHPNIAKNGEICVNTLKKDWKATLGLRHVLVVVRCLLIEPFPESALNEEAGKMLMEDYDGYARHARLMTSIHAAKANRPKAMCKTVGDNGLLGMALSETAPQSHIPLTVNMANTDSMASDALAFGVNISMDYTAVTSSPTAKKPKGDVGVKLSADKRKIDSRKKSLKRL